jgi:hypothetical protein
VSFLLDYKEYTKYGLGFAHPALYECLFYCGKDYCKYKKGLGNADGHVREMKRLLPSYGI